MKTQLHELWRKREKKLKEITRSYKKGIIELDTKKNKKKGGKCRCKDHISRRTTERNRIGGVVQDILKKFEMQERKDQIRPIA